MEYSNAFEAVGLDSEEATIQALRTDLATVIRDWIQQSQLTQAAAGRTLGVSQGIVSEIMNGRTGSKSIEYFVRLLARAGVAWTARAWAAPSDACAVKGPAPVAWVGVGHATIAGTIIPNEQAMRKAFWGQPNFISAVGSGGSTTMRGAE